jgi:hypothetical protein
MNKEQLEHYLKGGHLTATYKPKSLDISAKSKMFINFEIEVYQNMITSPLQSPERWIGQHAFNSKDIEGWFPEEDIENLKIINKFKDTPEPLPQYMYRLYYTEKSQFLNFGIEDIKLPLLVSKEYHIEADDHVLKLSDPQATKIEKCIYTGNDDSLEWIQLYPELKKEKDE